MRRLICKMAQDAAQTLPLLMTTMALVCFAMHRGCCR